MSLFRKLLLPALLVSGLVFTYQIPGLFTARTVAADTGKECVNTNSCTNPYRPSFDGFGNEFDYLGNLMKANCPNTPDPISGMDNPECVCSPGSYIQGYDKQTGKVICGHVTGCPYGGSIPLGPECDKFAPPDPTVDSDFIGK